MRAAISQVRGLGSAKQGVHHWQMQRLTAIANVFLVLWFVWSMVSLTGAGYAGTVEWLSSTCNATLMILLVISSFYHAKLGVQVVLEDYVHHEGLKIISLVALTCACFGLGAACVISILKVSLQG